MAPFSVTSCVCPIWPSSPSVGDSASLIVPSALFQELEKPSPRSGVIGPDQLIRTGLLYGGQAELPLLLDAQTDHFSRF